ncbi:MAG: ABC transporter ATP-binding protein [Planctomycetota bacterium]|nr:ABC transporter ATP-binding protein [Planctomycetota bacterium]
MTQSAALISAKEIEKVYRMGEVDVFALRKATLDIREGEFIIVCGPSGSGKSTLLNIIGGMDRPTSGRVTFRDLDLTQASDKQLTRFRREQVGFVFQFFNLIPSLTALENVQVAVELSLDPLDAHEVLDTVGLLDRKEHFPSQLSGGQQQRVAIARALAANPALILCDEPTGAIDTATGKSVLQTLFELNRNMKKTVVVITHDPSVRDIAHRVAYIQDGSISRIVENDSPVAPKDLDISEGEGE